VTRTCRLARASVALILACTEAPARISTLGVNWVEWPADVRAADSFSVRLVGYMNCQSHLMVSFHADLSAITAEPYALLPPENTVVCDGSEVPVDVGAVISPFDAIVVAPGLSPDFTRPFEVRAPVEYPTAQARPAAAPLPVRTFGTLTVHLDATPAIRTNAGGYVSALRDSVDCLFIVPAPLGPTTFARQRLLNGYLVENPPDTTVFWDGFVRGYLYTPPSPVCGQARVFHMISRE